MLNNMITLLFKNQNSRYRINIINTIFIIYRLYYYQLYYTITVILLMIEIHVDKTCVTQFYSHIIYIYIYI